VTLLAIIWALTFGGAPGPSGGAPRPVPDPLAKVCGKDADCGQGRICHFNPAWDPARACVVGCRPSKPNCPPKYTCVRDDAGWYRCRGPDGTLMGD
jgi:hypothetical protein